MKTNKGRTILKLTKPKNRKIPLELKLIRARVYGSLPKDEVRKLRQYVYALRAKYGLTLTEYRTLVKKQRGKCAICKKIPKHRLYVDHCHDSKRVRALLCRSCNAALGLFKDDVTLLRAALVYLKHFKQEKTPGDETGG
jgi:hypothetical protein